MTRKEYRAAVDAIQFTQDFQKRTIALLIEASHKKKQKIVRKKN